MRHKKVTATRLAVRYYMRQILHDWPVSVPALLLPGIGTVFVTYVPPLIVAHIITTFNNRQPTLEGILPYLLLFGGTWLLGEAIWRLALFCLNKTDAIGIKALYVFALGELLKKDIGFFHNNFSGALTKKTVGFSKNYESFLDTLSFSVIANLLPLFFIVVVLWRYSPWLVVALIGLIGLVIALVIPLTLRRQKLTAVREVASNEAAGYVADIIGNMDAVQAFAHEDYEARHHRKLVEDYMKKARRSWDYHNSRIDTTISPLYVLINVLGLGLALLVAKNTTTLAIIFVTFNYYANFTRVMWDFNRIYRSIENSLSEAAQYTELLLEPPGLQEAANPIDFQVAQGTIDFRKVDFAYNGNADHQLFANLNLSIGSGEKLALVGHSGGGKTTVTKLLLRFVDVTGGELLIDGQNIAHARLHDLRENIAYVPQEPIMFHRSIADNIRYGKLDATGDEVIAAAKKANAHEFIEKLPQGYETLVGERGVKLSGGQRQRVAIARAIIKNAPILVLDEATSALDSASEVLIQEALWKLMQGRTAIVIAHRLSTIQKMDRIVVLDNGVIVEEGSHKQLLSKNGTYAALWAHQSGGFIEE